LRSWLVAALLRLIPGDLRDPIAGDLEEECEAMARQRGRMRAGLWTVATAARLAARFRLERITHVRGVPPLGDELRRRRSMWDQLRQDLVFSARMLRRQPGFTIVALLALALGIGANTAIFSVVDAVLWRPLPYADADRIMSITEQRPREGRLYGPVSPADFYDWRHDAQSFSAMAAVNLGAYNLTGNGEPERIRVLAGTAALLDVLGVAPAIGRGFRLEEETMGQHRVVLLTDGLWRRRFGADPAVVGTTITFDGRGYQVVGILPPRWWWPAPIDVLVPLSLTPEDRRMRSAHFLEVLGRLKDGVSEAQAAEELNVVGARLARDYPDDNENHGPRIRALREWLVSDTRTALLVLLGAVGCVLLIACANVATLLLARAAGRQKELSVRRAVGATRGRLVQQMVTESLMVSAIGGTIGLLLAAWSLAAFRTILPAQFSELPGIDAVGLDGRMLAAALGASIVTGLVFGMLPALAATDSRIGTALHDESRGSSGSARTRRLRAALVVAELAVSLVLLAGAGLLIVSFARLSEVSPGFRPQQLVTVGLNLPSSRYGTPEQALAFYETLIDRLRAVPGVVRAAAVSAPPFTGLDARLNFTIERQSWELKGPIRAHPRLVSSDYFATMGIPLVRGRGLDDRDTPSKPLVTVINETAARRFWPNTDPIGQRINMDRETRWMEIVGIVGDVRHQALQVDAEPEVYIPQRQGFSNLGTGLARSLSIVVRTTLDGAAIAPAVRATVSVIDPQQPLGPIRPMEELITDSVGTYRLNFVLVSVFAAIALFLTAAGLYGVMSYIVTQRTREIGVRMALGATRGQVLLLMLRQAGTITLLGIAVGVTGALAATRMMASLLFGVSAADPFIYAAVSALLAAVALLAVAVPSNRATRVDPLSALRDG
jgi:putative ABC transport system permease protein